MIQHLIRNKFFNVQLALMKVSEIDELNIEKAILLIRSDRIEEALPLLFKLKFNKISKIILEIIKNNVSYELVYLVIRYLSSVKMNEIIKDRFNLSPLEIIVEIMYIIEDDVDLIRRLLTEDTFDYVSIGPLFDVFNKLLSKLESCSKNNKVQLSFMNQKILDALQEKIKLQQQFVQIGEQAYCSKCNRPIFLEAKFIYLDDKTLLHFSCYG